MSGVFEKRMFFIIGTQIAVGILLSVLILSTRHDSQEKSKSEVNQLKEVAARLQGVGLYSESARAYEEAWDKNGLEDLDRSKMSFAIGDLLDQAGKYEESLKWFYRAQVLDPDKKAGLSYGERIVALLERLKKFEAAEYALKQSTQLGRSDESAFASASASGKTGAIVAKIGEREITMSEIEQSLAQLPPAYQEGFKKNAEQKKEYVKKYVADLLLVSKAKKLNIDKDPAIRQQLQQILDQILVQKIFEQEVIQKVQVSETDLVNFYAAHKERYSDGKDKKARQLPFEQVRPQVEQEYRRSREGEIYQKLIEETLKSQDLVFYMDKVK